MSFEIILLILLLALLILIFHQVILLKNRLFEVTEKQDFLQEKLESERDETLEQFQDYMYIRDRLDLRRGLPYTPKWSAGPDFLKIISDHCLENKPVTILECGSGLTSLVLARCCEINNSGHVYSLENGLPFAAESRSNIERYGLNDWSSVIHAPLREQDIDGRMFQWYSTEEFPDTPIDMLVIDGPPGFLQKNSRYPALPILFDKLAENCTIYMDDAARADEREIVALWQKRFPAIKHEYIACLRGCSVLTLD